MINPIDTITYAIYNNCDSIGNTIKAREVAESAVAALDDEEIVAVAVQALKADGWTSTPEGPHGEYRFSDDELADIARTVLRSVGGA